MLKKKEKRMDVEKSKNQSSKNKIRILFIIMSNIYTTKGEKSNNQNESTKQSNINNRANMNKDEGKSHSNTRVYYILQLLLLLLY